MTERELDRQAAHRLAMIRHAQEVTGNVSKTCRYYGISRQVYYKWLRRYEEGGLAALRDGRRGRTRARTPPRPRSWARSSTCARPTISARTRSRCTSSDTTSSGSARRGSGGSSTAST